MIRQEWRQRRITDETQRIVHQIPERAGDRAFFDVDTPLAVCLALWSLVLWERKLAKAALIHMGVDWPNLAGDLDKLLDDKLTTPRVVWNTERQKHVIQVGYRLDDVLEPLLQQAEHEAIALGNDYVGSEHLLLAIVVLADDSLRTILEKHGIGPEAIKIALVEMRESPPI